MTSHDDEIYARYAIAYRALGELASRRHGYISDAAAERAGLEPDLREAAIEAGIILRTAPGLLNVQRSTPDDASLADRAIRAWIQTGERAVVSHASALAFLGLGELPQTLHLTFPLAAMGQIGAMRGAEIHYADVPEVERCWSARAPVPVTNVHRTLVDCAAAGLDPEVLARSLEEARRLRLVAAADAPERPRIADPALKLALLDELSALPELTERRDRMSRADLAAWARDAPIPEERMPTCRLKWSTGEILWAAVGEGDDGIICDLSGIEGYPALATVDLRCSQLASLEPLVALEQLTALHVGVTPSTSLAPLLRCANLKRVRLEGYAASSHAPVRAELEARGVVVDVATSEQPSGSAPFADPMLKLAVLEALSSQGELELPALVPIDEYELDRENLGRLLAIELTTAQLAAVEELVWECGCMTLDQLVWPQFDGETDEFAIRSLAGIDALPCLRALRLAGAKVDESSAELAALRARGVEVDLT